MAVSKKKRLGTIILWSTIVFILLLGVAVVGIWQYLFDHYIHPAGMENDRFPRDVGLDYREATVTAGDGVELKAWVVLPPEEFRLEKMPTIIALHGYGTCKADILDRTAMFANAGYLVFTYDHRHSGDSGGKDVSLGALETDDLLAVIEHTASLEEVDAEHIALYGYSMGGAAALRGTAADKRIKVLVADSPFATIADMVEKTLNEKGLPLWPFADLFAYSYKERFGISLDSVDMVEASRNISAQPLLLLAGDADTTVPVEHSKRIFAAAGEPKELVIFPGHEHEDNGSEEIFAEHIIPFLYKHFVKPVPLDVEVTTAGEIIN